MKDVLKNMAIPEMEDILSCNTCEYDAETHSDMNRHMAILHGVAFPPRENIKSRKETEVIEGGPDIRETASICGNCGDSFDNENDCVIHMSIHDEPVQLQCPECNSAFSTELEFEWHKETTHEVSLMRSLYQCKLCDFTSVKQHDLNQHMQALHMAVRVDIGTKDQLAIECNLCDYSCRYNIQLRKHLRTIHLMEQKYTCKECEYSTDYVANTWKHTVNQHPDKSFEITPDKDLVMKLVTE